MSSPSPVCGGGWEGVLILTSTPATLLSLFPWFLLVALLLAAYPWASWLLSRTPSGEDRLLALLLALGVGTGLLTLILFYQALLGFRINPVSGTLVYLAFMLPGWWLWWRSKSPSPPSAVRRGWSGARFYLLILALVSAAVLFNAAYWPFSHDDVLGIYGRYGREMAQTGLLVPFAGRDEAFYQAYPIHIPLTYTFVYLLSGWENEYLARVIPALLSLGCLGAVYVLGRTLYNRCVGWFAALLLALTPTFARWASSGYVDLPMAFYFVLAALFVWRLCQQNQPVDALLAGVCAGLMAWTKNAGLVGIFLLSLWLVFMWWRSRVGWGRVLIFLAACTLVAAPWYIRNWLEAGLIVPPTAWTDQAQRTMTTLLIFITRPENYLLIGWLVLSGVALALWRVVRRSSGADRNAFVLFLTLPYFGAWWLLVSYDPRFLLLFLPLLSILAGRWLDSFWSAIPAETKPFARRFAVLLALVLAVYIAWIAVQYKDEILRNPLMSDAEKHAIVIPESSTTLNSE